MTEYEPTDEQKQAQAAFATGKSLAIEAGAGAGKTSTLVLLARDALKEHRRGQYVAFNKAIATEAGAKMPSNVNASTAHSLAWKNVVSRNPHLQERLRNSRRMKSTEIADRLKVDAIRVQFDGGSKQLSRTFLAGLAMRAVIRFCQSADQEPEAKHVPYIDGIDIPPVTNGRRNRANNDVVARALVPAMRRAWADLTSDGGALPFRHDHYLKMWHLSGPKINADFILFDEAQDANPVLVDIIRQQTHAQLVWVGDSQQQIYSFTGAQNALREVGAEQRTFLTQSFRFGPAIATVANTILELLEAELRLTGTDTVPSGVGYAARPDVILCRTNATAVRNLLTAIKAGTRTHLVGGGREVIDFAKGAQRLQSEGWTDHAELACFSSWGEVQTYVEQDELGGELSLLVKLIDEFGVDTIIETLEHMPIEETADLIISTAHKSKGREWATVQLADDFPAEPAGEELRLLYVAVTRAKLHLDVTAVRLLNGGWTQEKVQAVGEIITDGIVETTPAERDRIIRRFELPVPFAGVAPAETPTERVNRIIGTAADQGRLAPEQIVPMRDALLHTPRTVEEHLAGVEGSFSVLGNGGRSGRTTKLGSYGDSRKAMEAASAFYGGGAFSVVTVIDEATGELVVQYDA